MQVEPVILGVIQETTGKELKLSFSILISATRKKLLPFTKVDKRVQPALGDIKNSDVKWCSLSCKLRHYINT